MKLRFFSILIAALGAVGSWVHAAELDPRDHPASEMPKLVDGWKSKFEVRRDWWSFKPLSRPAVPVPTNSPSSDHPVDRFLRAQLESRGLQPAEPADRSTLLRRVTLALTGLPPTVEEIEGFSRDTSADSYEKVVDRLLASPRFGERWARHWMDLVRYCESHGSQGDPELPMAWRYRDYLIRAFNADVPYDQLVREHIAGDLLSSPRLNPTEHLNESILGTAHLRMVEYGYIPVDALDDQVKVVDNQIDVFSKTFLGLTVSCARCHDHKFDPISQKDFYALYGIFASSRPGQVIVDAPNLREEALTRLASLKLEIRRGLGEAWSKAASQFASELREQQSRAEALSHLEAQIHQVTENLASLETAARQDLAREQGKKLTTGLPAPIAQWNFESDPRDSIGRLHGHLEGAAQIVAGRLILNGTNGWVVTDPLPVDLREKTLEAWVALGDLEQRGVGVITVQTPDSSIFDSIVFGERTPRHWMAGSDFFRRTRDVEGFPETSKPGELDHMVIVYASDNSITVFRNGVRYGNPYSEGTLQQFKAGSARIVFGKRHLAEGIPGLRGEIEEARLYGRALSSNEVWTSFQTGPDRIPAEALARAMGPEKHGQWTRLKTELAELQSKRTALMAAIPAESPWAAAFADAVKNQASPLHVWTKLAGLEGEALRDQWSQLSNHWAAELRGRQEYNRTNFTRGWELTGTDASQWFMSESTSATKPAPAGDFSIEPLGERVVRSLYPAGVFSSTLTRKEGKVFSSPRFLVEAPNISVRTLGEHSMARLVVENYAIGAGGLYPGRGLGPDEMGWVRLDVAYRKGSHAYLEWVTSEDFPNPGFRSGGQKFEDGRAWFGVSEVVFHQGNETPKELIMPAALLLREEAPRSVSELAERYQRALTLMIDHWRRETLNDEEVSFLNYFLRRDLLPVSLSRLPSVHDLVASYREVESGIAVPRRAPGVHEAAAFNQPLFQRGRPEQPGEKVPRRFLELLAGKPYLGTQSGRLELAGEVADPKNPLTSRLMVNRIWHHLFGRGLVATVDNFGRLGEQPSHPELLDYLAGRFIERGWSVKEMIRFLVTSKAYQQSSLASEQAMRLDPANRFLSHARVRRLEAESIRDSVLEVSGQLDLKMFGPGVDVYYVGKTEGGGPQGPLDGKRRRSIYQRIRRNAHNPFLEAFDAPKPSTTRGLRDATNVPAQSLTMLNDPFVIDQSTKWAKVLTADGMGRDVRIRAMFLRALGRSPGSEELGAARDYLAGLAEEHGVADANLETDVNVWRDFAQSLFCLKEFIYAN